MLQDTIYSHSDVTLESFLTLQTIVEDYARFYPHFDTVFAYRLIEFFSLSRNARFSSLSKGMASVFHFICAISSRARLTLLDEPVLGMDIGARRKIYDILLRDFMEHPRTIIISSHILSELEDLLSEFLIIDFGEIVLYQNQEEINSLAYRVEGGKEAVTAYITGRPVIFEEHKVTGSCAVIEDTFDENTEKDCRQAGLTVSRVRPEEIYLYKTNHGKGMDFECLWAN